MFDWIEFLIVAVPVGLALSLFALLGYLIYEDSQAEKFELRKDQWTCTQNHYETHTTFINNGKTTTPIIQTYSVCDVYTRK